MTADLSRIGALRVISRTSAMTFRTTKDIATIARELSVRYILEAFAEPGTGYGSPPS